MRNGLHMTKFGHAMGVFSVFVSNPGKSHWKAVKWILRYPRGMTKKCLYFSKGELKVQGYVDANFTDEVDHRKSPRVIYSLSKIQFRIGWMSQLQKIVALSTIEVECITVTEASKEMI